MLCTQVLNGAVNALHALSFDPAKDFEFVVVSVNPGETPALAREKKAAYVSRYGRAGGDIGFHFLTGREDSIKRLADAIGFRYAYDPAIRQFAHPALVTVLTPAGKVSRYLMGIDFAPRDMRLALVEAAGGKIGGTADALLLYCYHYDATEGKYSVAVADALRLGGLVTLVLVGALFVRVTRQRPKRR
jgi:protein SCO1/2